MRNQTIQSIYFKSDNIYHFVFLPTNKEVLPPSQKYKTFSRLSALVNSFIVSLSKKKTLYEESRTCSEEIHDGVGG